MGKIRTFSTGATRDTDESKLEPWGFTSALVEKAFSEYMHGHRTQSDGALRDSDNWTHGIPPQSYYHSLSRHVLDLRLLWEHFPEEAVSKNMIDVLCAIKFNVNGLLYEMLKEELRGRRGA